MTPSSRRRALKTIATAAMSASGIGSRPTLGEPRALRYTPEKDAALRLLRWKRYVEGDETAWLANTRRFTDQTGVAVEIESINPDDIDTKAALAANVGAGPDIVMGLFDQPQRYAQRCLDVTELADYLGAKYGGWYDVCKRYCTSDGRWIALPIGFFTHCLVYRESLVKAAGYRTIPRDLDGFLELCRALKANGLPAGFALGHATGDASGWCHWVIWAHGARLVDEQNRVAINSRETVVALEYAKELYRTFIDGTLSWLDPHNNKAFIAGQIAMTYNAISIYYTAKTSTDPAVHALAADIQHAHLPIGPIGRPTELAQPAPAWIFKHTRFPNAAREYLRFMLEWDQYATWQQASLGYITQGLRAYESNQVWTVDSKHTPYRDGSKLALDNGYAGRLGAASAACMADFIVVDMVAEVASGTSTPRVAAARAEQRARRYYDAR